MQYRSLNSSYTYLRRLTRPIMKGNMKRKYSRKKSQPTNNVGDDMPPFKFDLEKSSLIMVDSIETLQILNSKLVDCSLIGIDTETQPSFEPARFASHPPYKTSLMQMALRSATTQEESVFIVDLLAISRNDDLMRRLDESLEPAFQDEKCIKFGQSFQDDIRELFVSYPHMSSFRIVNGAVDTFSFLKYVNPTIMNRMSLKKLVQQHLAFNLIKSQQMSNWGKRPLTSAQIHYAACDALVLIRLFDAMNSVATEHSLTLSNGSDIDVSNEDPKASGTSDNSEDNNSSSIASSLAFTINALELTKQIARRKRRPKQSMVNIHNMHRAQFNTHNIAQNFSSRIHHNGREARRSTVQTGFWGGERINKIRDTDVMNYDGSCDAPHIPLAEGLGKHTRFSNTVE